MTELSKNAQVPQCDKTTVMRSAFSLLLDDLENEEWIRPSGKTENNKLIPNIIIDLHNKTKEEIIELLK